MLWFKKKEQIPPEHPEIIKLKSRISRLEVEIADIVTAQDILRDRIMKKLRKPKEEATEDGYPTDALMKTEDLNSISPFG